MLSLHWSIIILLLTHYIVLTLIKYNFLNIECQFSTLLKENISTLSLKKQGEVITEQTYVFSSVWQNIIRMRLTHLNSISIPSKATDQLQIFGI